MRKNSEEFVYIRNKIKEGFWRMKDYTRVRMHYIK